MHPPVSFHACKNYFSLIHHHPFRTHENTHAAVITLRISVRFVFFHTQEIFHAFITHQNRRFHRFPFCEIPHR